MKVHATFLRKIPLIPNCLLSPNEKLFRNSALVPNKVH